MAAMIIKPRKRQAFISLTLMVLAVALLIIWRSDESFNLSSVPLLGLVWMSLPFVLIVLVFVEFYSGYIKLENGELTRKSVFATRSVKVSDIREVSVSRSGTLPTSGLGAGVIGLGNAKDGIVGIKTLAYKKEELTPLIKQIYIELKSVNPKRAEELQKAFARYDTNL